MRELTMVLGVMLLLGVLSIAALVPPEVAVRIGSYLIAFGAIVGVPTGVWYHVLLHRALAPTGALPPGWIWSPIKFNDRVEPAQRGRVLTYCYLGGAGFAVICLGIVWIAVAITTTIARLR